MLPTPVLSNMSWMLLSCLMLLSQVQGEDSQKDLPSARISCPKGSQAYGSHCYALFKAPKSWTNADGEEPNGDGWEWSNSDVMNYFNWERNPFIYSDRGYCGSLSRNSGFLKWRDYNCDVQLPYVCKFTG
ncbi:regenerating islet-derived protein 3-beta-like isoform X2 [Perognathus longimembris pacificus]|uniref:regenerating islet-derived protein 3-beta-like isoform X2 n=1 Tax=Perognathus longimembris pacificus TaxID=214514 RepID=UPI002019D419|nr:regenerating islet-derived protein 3-beta-like isoform X2 [Perognathus longimembris pacificus]